MGLTDCGLTLCPSSQLTTFIIAKSEILSYDNNMEDMRLKLDKLKAIFSQEPSLSAGYLFGSYIEGKAHKRSDVDIAILIHPLEMKNFSLDKRLSLEVNIALELKSENFDLVILNLAPLIFQFRIISTGKLFYLKDDDVRSQFEERLMCSYYDFLPRLREFNREYFMALKEKYLDDR